MFTANRRNVFRRGDIAAELRCQNNFDLPIYAWSRFMHAFAAAGLDLLDVTFLDLDNPEDMRVEVEKVCELGFAGKRSVHPKQIAALKEVVTHSEV